MEALFACTKCHSRHPFEELSAAEQLCKVGRSFNVDFYFLNLDIIVSFPLLPPTT